MILLSSPAARVGRRLGAIARGIVNGMSYPARVLVGIGAPASDSRAEQGGPALRPGKLGHHGATRWVRGRKGRNAPRPAADGLEALARALTNPDPVARRLALSVVSEFSQAQAADLVCGAIYDPHADVRCAAAAAAARLQCVRAVSALVVALEDPVPDVRRASASAIEAITGMQLGPEEASRRRAEELMQWWKRERLAELAARSSLKFPSP
jgi:hypothetical protein